MAIPTPSSLQSLTAIMKQHYIDKSEVENVMIEAGPLINELLERADTSAGGANIPIPLITGSGGGVGTNFVACAGGAAPSTSLAYQLTRGYTFGVGLIDGEAMSASEAPQDAFIADLTLEVDTKKRRVAQLMAAYAYGDGTGVMAQVSSSQTVSSTTLTLADPSTAVRFQKGDWVQISATPGSAVRTAGTNTTLGTTIAGCAQIINVIYTGPSAGQVTLSGNGATTPIALNTIWTAVAAGDVIYLAGDNTANGFNGSSNIPYTSTNSAVPQGLLAWMPPGGPASSGDSFFGINRYQNGFAYGQVVDATASGLNLGSIREALTLTVSQLHQVSGRPSMIIVNPVAFYNLSLSLQSQGMYPGSKGQGPSDEGSFGFSELMMPTPHGMIRVVSDPQCAPFLNSTYPPSSGYSGAMTAFVLEEDTWGIFGKGEIPHLEESDIGNYFLRLQTANQFQYQLKAYWALASRAPGHSAACLLPNG
jgi:hypothetical protein